MKKYIVYLVVLGLLPSTHTSSYRVETGSPNLCPLCLRPAGESQRLNEAYKLRVRDAGSAYVRDTSEPFNGPDQLL